MLPVLTQRRSSQVSRTPNYRTINNLLKGGTSSSPVTTSGEPGFRPMRHSGRYRFVFPLPQLLIVFIPGQFDKGRVRSD